MKIKTLCDPNNWSDLRLRIAQDIADNGLKILNREGYLRNKPIAKTAIYKLHSGIGQVYYYDAAGKIMAGGYTIPSYDDVPIIGQLVTEPLEI